jgi:NAD(P)-dependent dehydrogenase (short-subunit alcohol dehydrogenase family)
MKDKVCVVTGANAGLGYETAKSLAEQGGTVAMICRSATRGEQARRQIMAAAGHDDVHLFVADLSEQAAIRRVAAQIRAAFARVDVLVNNAAAIASEHTLTPDGIELQFAVNHLAYFLLTQQLLAPLLAAERPRVVNVSSNEHRRGRIHFDNPGLAGDYHVLKAYRQAKLANVLFTYELDRRRAQRGIDHLAVNCLDPGTNHTDIGVKATNRWHALAWKLRRLVARAPAEGARCQIYLASSDAVEGLSGRYWYRCQTVASAPRSYDAVVAARLWALSAQYCGLENYFPHP